MVEFSVAQYYSHLGLTEKFDLLPTEECYVLKMLRDIDTTKVAGMEKLPRFLKDGADVPAKLVTDICNLSLYFNKFPSTSQLALHNKVEPIFKKRLKN